MKLQYIFILKPNVKVDTKDSNKLFQSIFKKIFDNVTFDTFQFSVDDVLETLHFKSSSADGGLMYLTIEFNDKPAQSAKVLSKVDNTLIQGSHRKDFYIINSYDEASEYYCEKLMPYFSKFERLMRSFIYNTLTKSLGFKWFEISFTDEIKKAIKEKGNISESNLIEHGLYEMTFAQLYDYLFREYSYCSAESAVYEKLLNQDLNNMDKTDIIDILESCRKENLWNRFFSKTTFDLEEPLRKMRDYRNTVAHNKFISYDEFTECKKSLKKINSTLENAIDQINSDIYTEKHLLDSIMSFAALFAGLLKNNYDIVSQVQKNFDVLGKTILKALEPCASISKMTTMYKFGSFFSDLQKLNNLLKSNIPKVDGIPNFYDTPLLDANTEDLSETNDDDDKKECNKNDKTNDEETISDENK